MGGTLYSFTRNYSIRSAALPWRDAIPSQKYVYKYCTFPLVLVPLLDVKISHQSQSQKKSAQTKYVPQRAFELRLHGKQCKCSLECCCNFCPLMSSCLKREKIGESSMSSSCN